MENKENIFLVKIQNCLKLLDEIEDTISNNPNDQSNISHLKKQYGLKTRKYNKGDK